MRWLETAIREISPSWAASRARNLRKLALYEAAQSNPWEPGRGKDKSTGSADRTLFGAQRTLRDRARNFDENYDIATGALDALVNWTIGPYGISVEPQIRSANGEINEDRCGEVRDYWNRWSLRPDASHEHTRAQLERLLGRSKYRDGEFFVTFQDRRPAMLPALGLVLKAMESDYCPMDSATSMGDFYQGIRKNNWGKPTEYLFYETHPGGHQAGLDYQRVPASQVIHSKFTKRLEQTRGVSIFATVMNRFADLKDYEESERVAARVAAAMTAYIKKGSPDMYDSDAAAQVEGKRSFQITPGIVFDNLLVGEEAGIIQGNRPNPELVNFRNAMLRAISAGTSASYSTTAKDYNGSYSAQRQELVEQFCAYNALTQEFIGQYEILVYRRFIDRLIAKRMISVAGIDLATLYDAEYRGPVMPWVDPQKETEANLIQVQAGFKTISQVHRERGLDPSQVMREAKMERDRIEREGLNFTSIERVSNE